jgi:hypothetical protein
VKTKLGKHVWAELLAAEELSKTPITGPLMAVTRLACLGPLYRQYVLSKQRDDVADLLDEIDEAVKAGEPRAAATFIILNVERIRREIRRTNHEILHTRRT